MRRSHIYIILLVLLVILALFYFLKTPKTIAPETTEQTATTSSGEVIFTYSTKTISEDNKDKSYSIRANYPVFALKDANVEKAVNNSVALFVQDEVSSAKSNFGDTNNPNGQNGQSTFSMSFSITTNQRLKDILPIKFDESFYSAGAAHPGDNIVTANYDLSTGQSISLASLFQPGSKYLETISSYSINALKNKLGSDADLTQIKTGAAPKSDNFQAFLITDQGLVIIFNEYQVAAYAAGEQEVTIPYSALSSILAKPL
jgi:hypothetical protein